MTLQRVTLTGACHEERLGTVVTTEMELAGVSLRWAAASDVGCVRQLNEDSFVASAPVFLVADGMGGHDAGEVASALTVSRFASLADELPPAIDSVAEEVRLVHRLLQETTVDGQQSDMGTTAVGIVMVREDDLLSWLIVNVGDSRAYVLSQGTLEQMTRDHSWVQHLVDEGSISPEEARVHPERNVIMQALGTEGDIDPDFWLRPISAGERFLLCSDGLTGEVTDEQIADILASRQDPQQVVDDLVELALEHGGRDNVTVVVLDVIAGNDTETTTETGVPPFDRATTSVEITTSPPASDEGASRANLSIDDVIAGLPPAIALRVTADNSSTTSEVIQRPPFELPAPVEVSQEDREGRSGEEEVIEGIPPQLDPNESLVDSLSDVGEDKTKSTMIESPNEQQEPERGSP